MKRLLFLVAVAWIAAGGSICHAAGWQFENSTTWNNQLATPAVDTPYTFYPGRNLASSNWYWTGASNIAWDNDAGGGWHDVNAGNAKTATMKFEFGKPLADFQLTTGKMFTHITNTDWDYSTDGINWTNLWHHDAPVSHETWDAAVTPLQTFTPAQNVTRIWIRYTTSAAYAQSVDTDPYMAISVTTGPQMGWKYENATTWNNQMDTPDYGASYVFYPGQDLAISNWYWYSASNIGFDNDAGGGWHDINGGSAKLFKMKFEFGKALSEFQFTTGKMFTHITDTDWDYSTDGTNWVNLWHHDAPATHETWDEAVTPLQTFTASQNVTRVWIRYTTSAAYAQSVDTDPYMQLDVATIERAVTEFSPDGAETANTYYLDQPPGIIIKPGGTFPTNGTPPGLDVYDLGRDASAGACTVVSSNEVYAATLPALSAGAYELRLTPPGETEALPMSRFALIHPARELTWEETFGSPFGLVGITRTGSYEEAAIVNGPLLGRMIGVHQVRGGIGTWIGVNTAEDVYEWNQESMDLAATNSSEYGLVYRGNLAWTPQWAVDMNRVAEGHWFGHYPPKEEYLPDYAEFCRQAATNVQGVFAPEFEIWNEPNNEPLGFWKGTFEEFVVLNHTAADAVHSVNPDARMVLGTTGDSDYTYISELFQAGLSNKFQMIDMHPYRHSDRGPEDGVLAEIHLLQREIDHYGDNQSIIFTEIGWPTYTVGDHPMYAKVTRFQQACYFSRTLLISLAAGVERVHFHMMPDWGTDPANPEHHFGVVDVLGQPKQSLVALSGTHRHLEQAVFEGVVEGYPDYHHVWAWDTPWVSSAVLLTVWCDTGTPQWIDLPDTPLSAEDMWGGTPGTDRLRYSGGTWQILPDEDPLFVYLPDSTALDLGHLPSVMRPWHLTRLVPSPIGDMTMEPLTGTNAFVFSGAADSWETYALQGKTNLMDAAWSNCVEDIPGVGVSVTVTGVVDQAQSFYRLIME